MNNYNYDTNKRIINHERVHPSLKIFVEELEIVNQYLLEISL